MQPPTELTTNSAAVRKLVRRALLTFLLRFTVLTVLVLGAHAQILAAERRDIADLIDAVSQVESQGKGHREAMAAWRELANAGPDKLPQILAAMDDANPLAMNWLRNAAETIVDRTLKKGGVLPRKELEQYVVDRDHHPLARRMAFEWLEQVDPAARVRLVPTMLDDPSSELRRDAIDSTLQTARTAQTSGDSEAAVANFQRALAAASDVDQIKSILQALKELEVQVEPAAALGFLTQW
jgi:hypothetical protein